MTETEEVRKAVEAALNEHIIAFTKVYPRAIDDLLTSLAFDGFEIKRIEEPNQESNDV